MTATFAIGLIFGLVAGFGLCTLKRARDRQALNAQRSRAAAVLREHGYQAARYEASRGVEDRDLARVLDLAAADGRVVVDGEGDLVGRVFPPNVVELRRE